MPSKNEREAQFDAVIRKAESDLKTTREELSLARMEIQRLRTQLSMEESRCEEWKQIAKNLSQAMALGTKEQR